MPKPTPWWMLYIVAPVVAGVILLIAGGVVEDIFGSDDEHETTPPATSPAPVGPSSPPAPVAPAPSPTAGAFAQRANEICVDTPRIGEFRRPIKDLIPRALNGDKSAELAVLRQIERFKDVLRERQRRVKALRTPRGEARATAEDFVRADSSIQQGQLAALSAIQDGLKKGDRGALSDLVSQLKRAGAAGGGAKARRDALARMLGAKQCVSGPTS